MNFTRGKSNISNQNGMTLVELLIAITLSVILAGYSYTLFQSVMTSKERINASQQSLVDLRLFFQLIEKDLIQLHPLATERDTFGQVEPAVVGTQMPDLTISRLGWSQSPIQKEPRSHLQRVNWTLQDQSSPACRHTFIDGMMSDGWSCLVRSYNLQMDSLYDDDIVVIDIVGYIQNLNIEYLYQDNNVTINRATQWPLFDAPQAVLKAIDIKLEHQRFGVLNWLFEVPQV